MTLIIGILCSDGAVLGADGAATFGPGLGETTIRQPVRNKLRVIGSDAVAGMSGSVGLSQRFSAMIEPAILGDD
jgi:20S proteasome alpha/beta subunit